MVGRQRCPRCEGAKVEKRELPDGRFEIKPCVECHGAGYVIRIVGTRKSA